MYLAKLAQFAYWSTVTVLVATLLLLRHVDDVFQNGLCLLVYLLTLALNLLKLLLATIFHQHHFRLLVLPSRLHWGQIRRWLTHVQWHSGEMRVHSLVQQFLLLPRLHKLWLARVVLYTECWIAYWLFASWVLGATLEGDQERWWRVPKGIDTVQFGIDSGSILHAQHVSRGVLLLIGFIDDGSVYMLLVLVDRER